MNSLDWVLLVVTFALIVLFGIYKNRKDKNLDSYLLGDQSLPWYHVGLSLMATQASTITFLSAPGEGFANGMAFVQFYLGLPLAMVVLSITFVPIFHKLKVYTAYEYLENRFDSRVRSFIAVLFLLSRGLATGLAIYAPAIIIATIFQWDITWTNIIMGIIILFFTIIGGTKAISHTHFQQMLFMTIAMFVAGGLIVSYFPENVTVVNALKIAGKADRMNILSLDPNHKYNLWSGLIGGFFLQLSYFGTDQSQVGRFLTGKSVTESRIGLLMNGITKIPMQFGIILIGVFMFVFYLFNETPVFHNQVEVDKLKQSIYSEKYEALELANKSVGEKKKEIASQLNIALNSNNEQHIDIIATELENVLKEEKNVKAEVSKLIKENNAEANDKDINFVFLNFVINKFPHGFVGILIAIIICASIGAIASALSSLSATTATDVLKIPENTSLSSLKALNLTKGLTFLWGIFIILVAIAVQRVGGSMIEVVNILGSWFYGVILGVFLIAFYFKNIESNATFYAALVSQILVILIWYVFTYQKGKLAFLWLNPIGVILVVLWAYIFRIFLKNERVEENIDN